MNRIYKIIFCLYVINSTGFLAAQHDYIYWTDNHSMYRGTIDGSSYESIIPSPREVSVFDAADGVFYWFENGCILKKSIEEANTDTIISGIESVTDILVDPKNQKLYWNEFENGKIWQSDLNGLNVKELVSGAGNPGLLKLDVDSNTLYWIDDFAGKLQRIDMDSAEIVDILSDVGNISDFEIDTKNNKVFLVDKILDELKKMNMDGSDIEIVLSGFYSFDIELDPSESHIYFYKSGSIYYSDLNGENQEVFIKDFEFVPKYLNFDMYYRTMYWLDGTNRIQYSKFDDGVIRDIIINFRSIQSLVLDVPNRSVYWRDHANIFCSNLDGSNITYIANAVSTSGGADFPDITLDTENKKIYWSNFTDFFNLTIGRANFDGTDIDFSLSLSSGWKHPFGIAVDPHRRMVYWTNYPSSRRSNSIRRIGFDGGDVEILVDSLLAPYDLALDLKNNKVYWTELSSIGVIQRANLDGSNMETILSCMDWPCGIALDVAGGKMYWTEKESGKIKRANLNGTDVEDIFSGLSGRTRIALTFENDGWTAVEERQNTDIENPVLFSLEQNYPNPFNPRTQIEYSLAERQHVNLDVFSTLGQHVATLVDARQNAGSYKIQFNAGSLSSGVYIYRLTTDRFTQQKKMILMK